MRLQQNKLSTRETATTSEAAKPRSQRGPSSTASGVGVSGTLAAKPFRGFTALPNADALTAAAAHSPAALKQAMIAVHHYKKSAAEVFFIMCEADRQLFHSGRGDAAERLWKAYIGHSQDGAEKEWALWASVRVDDGRMQPKLTAELTRFYGAFKDQPENVVTAAGLMCLMMGAWQEENFALVSSINGQLLPALIQAANLNFDTGTDTHAAQRVRHIFCVEPAAWFRYLGSAILDDVSDLSAFVGRADTGLQVGFLLWLQKNGHLNQETLLQDVFGALQRVHKKTPRADLMLQISEAFARLGQSAKAALAMSFVLKTFAEPDPQAWPESFLQCAALWDDSGNSKAAIKVLRDAERRFPNDLTVCAALALRLECLPEDQHAEKIAELRGRIANQNPDDGQNLLALARALQASAQARRAAYSFKRFADQLRKAQAPGSGKYYLLAVEAYLAENLQSDARKLLLKLRDEYAGGCTSEELDEAQERFKRLQKATPRAPKFAPVQPSVAAPTEVSDTESSEEVDELAAPSTVGADPVTAVDTPYQNATARDLEGWQQSPAAAARAQRRARRQASDLARQRSNTPLSNSLSGAPAVACAISAPCAALDLRSTAWPRLSLTRRSSSSNESTPVQQPATPTLTAPVAPRSASLEAASSGSESDFLAECTPLAPAPAHEDPWIPPQGPSVTIYEDKIARAAEYRGHSADGRVAVKVGDKTIWGAPLQAAPVVNADVFASVPLHRQYRPSQRVAQLLNTALEKPVCGTHSGHDFLDAFEETMPHSQPLIVGGAVRDVISFVHTPAEKRPQALVVNDIDAVTTLLPDMNGLLISSQVTHDFDPQSSSMPEYPGSTSSRWAKAHGIISFGGMDIASLRVGGFYERLKAIVGAFLLSIPAEFGYDVMANAMSRNFCCCALYWSRKRKLLLDPTGRGLQDAIHRRLSLPTDLFVLDNESWFWSYCDMRTRGYTAEPDVISAVSLCIKHFFGTEPLSLAGRKGRDYQILRAAAAGGDTYEERLKHISRLLDMLDQDGFAAERQQIQKTVEAVLQGKKSARAATLSPFAPSFCPA